MKNKKNSKIFKSLKNLLCFAIVIISCFTLFGCGQNEEKIGVDSIEISKKNLYMAEGQTAVISAQVYPFNATNQSYTFESSNESVVSVEDGFITARKAGDAVIYVYSEDGGYQDSCNVLVTRASDNLALNGYNNLNMPPKELEPIYNNDETGEQVSKKNDANSEKRYTAKNLNNKNSNNTKNNEHMYNKNKKYGSRVSNEYKNNNDIPKQKKVSRNFKDMIKNQAQIVNAEVQNDITAGKSVIENLKLDLQNSIQSLNAEKDMIMSDMPHLFKTSLTDAFDNIRCDMIDMFINAKQSILDDLSKTEENLESGEYSVESKNLNGVTFVVIKNNANEGE
ncbi:MAG TPA: hypothetical protein DCO89_00655 [Clostridiales bacterium]|nr:hypothetical protein [Clostridiales bacterium]